MKVIRHHRARQIVPAAIILPQAPPKLLTMIERACESHGVAPSRFGRDALNDWRLVKDMRAGRHPRAATRTAILAHIDRLAGSAGVQS